MARFFFHVVTESREYADAHGQEFPDLKGAKAHAAKIAKEFAEDGYFVGAVCIFDEKENQLDRVPLRSDSTRGE
jgi:hypothetical protein